MFAFELYDDCDVSGRSRDSVEEDLKKEFRFSVHCDGLSELDGSIFVWLNERGVHFLRESDEVSDAEKGKVIAAVSLTNPKDTGLDLLYFAQYIKKGDLIPDTCSEDQLEAFLNRTKEVFKDFPFFEDDNKDRVFMRLCLLEFLLAVDTHDEIFAVYPRFDELRKKLRESKVYLLLCAKLRYCMYHYKGRGALCKEEYTFVVSKYADLLMDSDYNKMVPLDYYDEPRFLYNPEYELKSIMKREDSKSYIEKAVIQKISNFFLTKHAVIEASLGQVRRSCRIIILRIIHLLLMLLVVLWSLISLISFDAHCEIIDFFYKDIGWKWGVVGCLLIEAILAFIQSKSLVFHPRIIVALMLGWFTIAVSEDLIKSQLELKCLTVWIAVIVVLLIVGLMLKGEVKRHSPYYRFWWPWKEKNYPKTSVVLIYTMFWNLLLGVLMQTVTYSPLLETSGAVPDVVLGQLPKKVEKYKNTIETSIDMLDDFEWSMDGVIHDYGKSGNAKALEASSSVRRHNELLDQISDWIDEAEEFVQDDSVLRELGTFAKTSEIDKNKASDSVRKIIENNLNKTRKIKNNLRIQLLRIDDFAQQISDNETLKEIGKVKNHPEQEIELPVKTDNAYLEKLEDPIINEHLFSRDLMKPVLLKKNETIHLPCIKRRVPIPCIEEIPLFPRMLIFHSLIVLIIAIVGNLIISDKSVTEPL